MSFQPRSLKMFHVRVPLRKPIQHASHSRTDSDNLVVAVSLGDGTVGYGEGVPRSYVTGETIESTFDALARVDLPKVIESAVDYPSLVGCFSRWVMQDTADDPRQMAGNSARCALEMAVLDAYGRSLGRSIGEALRFAVDQPADYYVEPQSVRYSGAITAESIRGEKISAWKMKLYGFHQVKVKVGVDGQDDPTRLRVIRRILGGRRDIRIDANEAWDPGEVISRWKPLMAQRISILEQPVPHGRVDELGAIRAQMRGMDQKVEPPEIMLDESLCGMPDALKAIDRGLAGFFNLRLSKCGGFIPTSRIYSLARRSGIGIQLGCHPGETGLLSAAGRHFAGHLRGIQYLEGSYDRHVLARNLIHEDITFRYGGKAKPLKGAGLGVTVDTGALDAMTVKHREICYG